MSTPLLELRGVSVDYLRPGFQPARARRYRALDDVSFGLADGSALGVVGESGSGKSTLARAVLRLVRPSTGGSSGAGSGSTARRAAASPRSGASCRWCSRIRLAVSTRA